MRLLIVDDSALMRRVLQECFADVPDVETRVARDGEDALAQLHDFQPEVITLDINMPKMDGLTCLAHIMEERPCPVIMVSSLTEKGALATLEALELGAVDFIAKPDGTVSLHMRAIFDDLRAKVRSAHRSAGRSLRAAARETRGAAAPARERAMATTAPAARLRPATPERAAPVPRPAARNASRPQQDFGPARATDLVLIGSSTGGPRVLGPLLEALPANFPAPILIAQHMPERFTRVFAERLSSTCAITVRELSAPMPLEPGNAYVAMGGMDVEVTKQFNRLTARPVTCDESFTWHPSVSRMTASANALVRPDRLLGVMLTGMGDDGSEEMTALCKSGGRTIAESEETAAVFGMPQRLIALDGATVTLPSHDIAAQILRWVKT